MGGQQGGAQARPATGKSRAGQRRPVAQLACPRGSAAVQQHKQQRNSATVSGAPGTAQPALLLASWRAPAVLPPTLARQLASTSRFGDLRSRWMMGGLRVCRCSMPRAASSACAGQQGSSAAIQPSVQMLTAGASLHCGDPRCARWPEPCHAPCASAHVLVCRLAATVKMNDPCRPGSTPWQASPTMLRRRTHGGSWPSDLHCGVTC